MQESLTIENMLLCWMEAEVESDWLLDWVTGNSGGSAVSVEHEAELKRWAIFIPPHLMHTHCLLLCSLQSLLSLSIFCLVQSHKDIKPDTPTRIYLTNHSMLRSTCSRCNLHKRHTIIYAKTNVCFTIKTSQQQILNLFWDERMHLRQHTELSPIKSSLKNDICYVPTLTVTWRIYFYVKQQVWSSVQSQFF